jgi:hypothetical protein
LQYESEIIRGFFEYEHKCNLWRLTEYSIKLLGFLA